MNPAVVAFGVATNTINSAEKIIANAYKANNAFNALTQDPGVHNDKHLV